MTHTNNLPTGIPAVHTNAQDTFSTKTSAHSIAERTLSWTVYNDIIAYVRARYEHEHNKQPDEPPVDMEILLDTKRPFDSACKFLEMTCCHQGILTLWYHREDYWRWEMNSYRKVEGAEIEREIMLFLTRTVAETKSGEIKPFPVAPRYITEIEKILRRLLLIPSGQTSPHWMGVHYGLPSTITDPTRLIFGKSSTLNLANMKTLPPTPLWFNAGCLDFDHDPRAECPQWHAFLDSILDDDEESKQTIMEFMGLCLTPITKFQKALFLIGQRRCGKGTIARITRKMVGEHNTAPQKIADFGQHFGLESLVGKTFTPISDARFGRQDLVRTVETILNIVGEDLNKVNKKFKQALHVQLQIKIMLISNHIPRIPDPSGALPGRFIFIKLPHSFWGKEDYDLEKKLTAELPGILNLAILHLGNLLERGQFVQPETGIKAFEQMMALSSPVSRFIEELEPYEHPDSIWAKWLSFCASEREPIGTKSELWVALEAAAYCYDPEVAKILAKIKKRGGEAAAHDLRDCSRNFRDSDVRDKKLREMVKLGLLKVRNEVRANNRIVEFYSIP